MGVISSSIIPRSLGAEAYGQFGFLRSAFEQIFNLGTLGTLSAFQNYNARTTSFQVLKLYSAFSLFLVLIVFSCLFGLYKFNQLDALFPNINFQFVLLGGLFGLSEWLATL